MSNEAVVDKARNTRNLGKEAKQQTALKRAEAQRALSTVANEATALAAEMRAVNPNMHPVRDVVLQRWASLLDGFAVELSKFFGPPE